MKKFLMLSYCLCFSSFALAGGVENIPVQTPAPYVQESGPYFGIHGGIALPTNGEFFTGFDVGAQLGYRFNPHIRAEGAFTFLRNNFNSRWFAPVENAQNSYLFMANALYDFHLTSVIDPFIGFGIGLNRFSSAEVRGIVHPITRNSTSFAYQAIAGIALPITPNITFSARYRYVGTTDNFSYNIVDGSFDYFF